MKETFYFSHDYNARADAKIKRLMKAHGVAGYGIYWSIIEDLYQNANALPTDYDSIAYDLHMDSDIVKSVVNDFDLFIIEDGNFGSISVSRRLSERDEKSEKARKSAYKRWDKDNDNANAMRTQCNSNAIKEIKGKEIKEKDSKLFSDCVGVYFEFYENLTGIKPQFGGAQGSNLKKLLNLVQKTMQDNGKEITDETVVSSFRALLQNLPKWYKEHLDINVIYSKYDNIIAEIRAKSTTNDAQEWQDILDRRERERETVASGREKD